VFFSSYYEKEHATLMYEGDRLIGGCLKHKPIKIRHNNKDIDVPFIVGMFIVKEYQGKGYMKLMLNHIEDMYKDKDFIALQAYNWTIYASSGYTKHIRVKKYEILGDFADGYEPLIDGCDPKLMLDTYNHFVKEHKMNFYHCRDLDYFKKKIMYQEQLGQRIYQKEDAYIIVENKQLIEGAYSNRKSMIELIRTVELETALIPEPITEEPCNFKKIDDTRVLAIKEINGSFEESKNN
jgi:predicted acetyltransferase